VVGHAWIELCSRGKLVSARAWDASEGGKVGLEHALEVVACGNRRRRSDASEGARSGCLRYRRNDASEGARSGLNMPLKWLLAATGAVAVMPRKGTRSGLNMPLKWLLAAVGAVAWMPRKA
jgi:hypothetical protein